MTTQSNWKSVQSWNVGNPDGSVEKYTLYEDEITGSFKIENDFGNISIEMERMSGYEFLRNLSREVTDILDSDMNTDADNWLGGIDCDDID